MEWPVRSGRAAVVLGRTWRFRDVDDPAVGVRWPTGPALYACWHEYLLAFALLGRDRGIASLASRHADGEIVSRIVSDLGFVMARGSSSRGGASGFRQLLRAARAGRSIYLTTDGPRGPRHVCQPGIVRLAARAGHPIVPMGMAVTSGIRLRSWDRFLVPTPGARVFVAFGKPIHVAPEEVDEDDVAERVGRETDRQVARCEAVAGEARAGRPYAVRSVFTALRDEPTPRSPLADGIEQRLRAAWKEPRPAATLRAASGAVAVGRAVRHAAYDTGLIASHRPSIPVVSVGGVTVGGSGKTPLALEVAAWLRDAGHRPAILSRGYADEMLLHRSTGDAEVVLGHPDRIAIAERAAARGATVSVLDDGLQHRRIARDMELLAIDRDALRRTNGRTLPAGPFREDPARALARADAVILGGREPRTTEIEAFEGAWLDRLSTRVPAALMSLETGPAHEVRRGGGTGPTVALTGVMKPNLFFDSVRAAHPTVVREHALPDHGWPGASWTELVAAARDGGFVMTRKDFMRLASLIPEDVGVWVVPERIVWHAGRDDLRRAILEGVGTEAGC